MMREHNRASISNTSVHEAYPGHHLQLSAAITNPSLVRLFSGAPEFSEGWAFYCERMMKERGFDDTPKGWYVVHTDAIWRATRIILDVQLHRGLIGFDDAVERLVAETGFERPAALAEVKRYTSTPTYQLSYLFGRHMIEKLKAEVQAPRGDRLRHPAIPRHADLRRHDAGQLRPSPVRRERPVIGLRRVVVGLACAFALAACGSDPTPTPAPPCPTEPPTSVSAQATLEGAELATMTVGGAVEGEIVDGAVRRPGADRDCQLRRPCPLRLLRRHQLPSGHQRLRHPGRRSADEDRIAGTSQGSGTGGPGYEFEIEPPAEGLRYDPYVVAMANNSGRPTAASSSSTCQTSTTPCARSASTPSSARSLMGTDVVDSIAEVPVNDPQLGLPLDAGDHRVDQHLGRR